MRPSVGFVGRSFELAAAFETEGGFTERPYGTRQKTRGTPGVTRHAPLIVLRDHSARVEMHLLINGFSVSVTHMAPDFLLA
jgi:hypothetical protein